MSAEATGWVFRYSPYSAGTFLVHLCIADSVNDQNRNEFWMRQTKLAEKARLTRPRVNEHVQKLCDDGFLTLLDASTGVTGKARRYRFEMPDVPMVYDPQGDVLFRNTLGWGGVASGNRGVPSGNMGVFSHSTQGVPSGNTEPKRTQELSQRDLAGICDLAFGDAEHVCGPFCPNALPEEIA